MRQLIKDPKTFSVLKEDNEFDNDIANEIKMIMFLLFLIGMVILACCKGGI